MNPSAAPASGPRPPSGTTRCFRPHERLRSSRQYQRVRRTGRRFKARHMRINAAANGLPFHRLGLVVQKRFWNAVGRNRVKRCIREAFRLSKCGLAPPHCDIVVVALPGIDKLGARGIARELSRALAGKNHTVV